MFAKGISARYIGSLESLRVWFPQLAA